MSGVDPLARLRRLNAKRATTRLVSMGALHMPDVPRTPLPADLSPDGSQVYIRVPGSEYRIGQAVAYRLTEDGAFYGVFRPTSTEASAGLLARALDPPAGWFGAITMPPCDGFSHGHLEIVTRDLVPTEGVLRLPARMPDLPATYSADRAPLPARVGQWFAQTPGGDPDFMVGTVELWVDRFGRWWPTAYEVKPDWAAQYRDRGLMLQKALGLPPVA